MDAPSGVWNQTSHDIFSQIRKKNQRSQLNPIEKANAKNSNTRSVTPQPHGYGHATVTYIRRAKIPSHMYAKHQYMQKSEYESMWCYTF